MPSLYVGQPRLRLIAACLLSLLLHLLVLAVPVNPTGGEPGVVSLIQARLELAEDTQAPAEAAPAAGASAPPAPPADPAAERREVAPAEPAAPAKPAPPPPAPGSGVEVPLIRDPVYYPARQLDVYPQPVALIQPKCPEAALARRLNGRVQLLLLIDEFGVVNEASVAEAQPEGVFDDVTVQSFRQARFVPAQKQGRHVKSRVLLRVNYLCGEREPAAP